MMGLDYSLIMAIMIAAFVGPAAGYLGSIMITRRMALVGDALSHVALPGLALGLLFNFSPFVGAFVLLAAAMVVTWYLQKSTVLPVEAIVGVIFVFALAVGVLITPEPELLEALFGDISSVTPLDTATTAVVTLIIIALARYIYRPMALVMVSGELASSIGVKVESINLLYLLLVAGVVAIGIRVVGTLLVGAVVIVPAAAARGISGSLRGYSILSSAFGGMSAVGGILIASAAGVPAGPMVVITGIAIFIAALILNRTNITARRQ